MTFLMFGINVLIKCATHPANVEAVSTRRGNKLMSMKTTTLRSPINRFRVQLKKKKMVNRFHDLGANICSNGYIHYEPFSSETTRLKKNKHILHSCLLSVVIDD